MEGSPKPRVVMKVCVMTMAIRPSWRYVSKCGIRQVQEMHKLYKLRGSLHCVDARQEMVLNFIELTKAKKIVQSSAPRPNAIRVRE